MRQLWSAVLVLVGFAVAADCVWAQRGIPFVPRAPSVPHIVPHFMHGRSGNGQDSDDWLVPALVIGGGAIAAWVGVRAWKNRSAAVRHVRIVETPPGEAPEEIRRAWVGAELPLCPGQPESRRATAVGVLSGADPEVAAGYRVYGQAALDALALHAPQAAAWWRENAPHVLAPGYQLFFPEEVCERVW